MIGSSTRRHQRTEAQQAVNTVTEKEEVLTCNNMTEEHLPEGFVLASEEPEEQGMQLSGCKLHFARRSLAKVR